VQESCISIRRQTNRQARGDGNRKEVADVGPEKLLLLLSCSAVPDGWARPACCISVYRGGHRLAAPEGGREAEVPRLASRMAPHRHGLLLTQSAGSPAGLFL